jgi:hypothetical protein
MNERIERFRVELVLRGMPEDHVDWYFKRFRADVLREAAERLRQGLEGPLAQRRAGYRIGMEHAADLIDPDKGN